MTTRRRLPNRRPTETFEVESQGLKFTASIGRFADGRVAEIFLQNHKAGSSAGINAQDAAVVCSIALQYGLDYPNEVKGLVLMTVAARPKTRPAGAYEFRLRAAEDPKAYEEWLAYQRHSMKFVEPGLREQLMERHRQVGPLSQYHDLKTIDAFDVRDRLATLKPKLLLLRGLDDPGDPPEYEKEMHEAVPGSRYVKLPGAGHFPPTEIPDKVNALIEEFVATL